MKYSTARGLGRAHKLVKRGNAAKAAQMCSELLPFAQVNQNVLRLTADIESAGKDYLRKKNLVAAIECFRFLTRADPDKASGYDSLARAFAMAGDLSAAVNVYLSGFQRLPHDRSLIEGFIEILRGRSFAEPCEEVALELDRLLRTSENFDSKVIMEPAISLLKFDTILANLMDPQNSEIFDNGLSHTIGQINKVSMLVPLLKRAPVCDLNIEAFLKNTRAWILLNRQKIELCPQLVSFLNALAIQCFINEFVYSTSNTEKIEIEKLENQAKKLTASALQPPTLDVLCLACYRSLYDCDWVSVLKPRPAYEEVYTIQYLNQLKETEFVSSLDSLKAIDDATSLRVKAQYESNPYPRWTDCSIPAKKTTFESYLQRHALNFRQSTSINLDCPDILIAGCGTGKHSIEVFGSFKWSSATAIDLSGASLGYAKRKTQEKGLSNIRYIQGDILDASKLEKKFDVIESSGTLHHMQDPRLGWERLRERLKPNGIMRIGLYSRCARRSVSAIREKIKALGISSDAESIRNFRDQILGAGAGEAFELGTRVHDFYTMSELRDLWFHEEEHVFDLLEIAELLDSLDLRFCGFAHSLHREQFSAAFANPKDQFDLEKWHRFETSRPMQFIAMYQFFCQDKSGT